MSNGLAIFAAVTGWLKLKLKGSKRGVMKIPKWFKFCGSGLIPSIVKQADKPNEDDPDAPPCPAVLKMPDDLLAEAIAYVLTRQMRAVVYARAPHKAREMTKKFKLVDLIREPGETKITITYTIDINTTAILAALALILPERGSKTK